MMFIYYNGLYLINKNKFENIDNFWMIKTT